MWRFSTPILDTFLLLTFQYRSGGTPATLRHGRAAQGRPLAPSDRRAGAGAEAGARSAQALRRHGEPPGQA